MTTTKNDNVQQVWGLPVRLAHWLLAALVVYCFFAETGPEHRLAGYLAAAIVLARLLAGQCGAVQGPTRLYWPAPAACLAQVRGMMSDHVASRAGHTPLGMAMSLLIWLLVLLLGITGWACRLDMFWGEDWLMDTHAAIAWTLMAAVVLHLLGVALSSRAEHQNLARAMVTGMKRVDD